MHLPQNNGTLPSVVPIQTVKVWKHFIVSNKQGAPIYTSKAPFILDIDDKIINWLALFLGNPVTSGISQGGKGHRRPG